MWSNCSSWDNRLRRREKVLLCIRYGRDYTHAGVQLS